MAKTDYHYELVLEGAETLSKKYGMPMVDTLQRIIEEDLPDSIDRITLDMLECTDREEMDYLVEEMLKFKVLEQHYTIFAVEYLTEQVKATESIN